MLRIAFAVAPIAFGLDKFFNVLTDWPQYLAVWVDDLMPGSAQDFMYVVGGDRDPRRRAGRACGRATARRSSRCGSPGSSSRSLTGPGYYDVALRDFGLLLGALTLTRLAFAYDR